MIINRYIVLRENNCKNIFLMFSYVIIKRGGYRVNCCLSFLFLNKSIYNQEYNCDLNLTSSVYFSYDLTTNNFHTFSNTTTFIQCNNTRITLSWSIIREPSHYSQRSGCGWCKSWGWGQGRCEGWGGMRAGRGREEGEGKGGRGRGEVGGGDEG